VSEIVALFGEKMSFLEIKEIDLFGNAPDGDWKLNAGRLAGLKNAAKQGLMNVWDCHGETFHICIQILVRSWIKITQHLQPILLWSIHTAISAPESVLVVTLALSKSVTALAVDGKMTLD
jgi:hypothetical protein